MESQRLTFAFALLISVAAHAQYNTSSLGLGTQVATVVDRGLTLGLTFEYARYLDAGFEAFARAPLTIVEVPVGADTSSGAGRVFGTGLSLGARYLFYEDTVRPWVGLQISSSILITAPNVTWNLGAGPIIGLDLVLSESFALSVRGWWDLFVELNAPWRHQVGATLGISILL